MYKKITSFIAAFLLVCISLFSSELTKPVFVNFGQLPADLPWASYAPWNTFQNCWAGNPGNGVDNLLDSLGNATGIKIQVTGSFAGYNPSSGVAETSTILNMPDKVSLSNFYANTQLPGSSQITISNLDQTKAYSFICFSSRSGSGAARNTQFTFIGTTTKSADHNSYGNTTETSLVENVSPDANGTIIMNVGFAPGFSNYYYISALKIMKYDLGTTTSLKSSFDNEMKIACQGDNLLMKFNSDRNEYSTLEVYSVNGQMVKKENISILQGKNSLTTSLTSQGLYFVKVKINGKTYTHKIIK